MLLYTLGFRFIFSSNDFELATTEWIVIIPYFLTSDIFFPQRYTIIVDKWMLTCTFLISHRGD